MGYTLFLHVVSIVYPPRLVGFIKPLSTYYIKLDEKEFRENKSVPGSRVSC